jgi:hypothetical protein
VPLSVPGDLAQGGNVRFRARSLGERLDAVNWTSAKWQFPLNNASLITILQKSIIKRNQRS